MDVPQIYVREDEKFANKSALHDNLDSWFRVGKYVNKATDNTKKNLVVLFDHLESEQDKANGYTMFTMPDKVEERTELTEFIKFVLEEHGIKENVFAFLRLHKSGYEFHNEVTVLTKEDIEDIATFSSYMASSDDVIPICVVAHIDNLHRSYVHVHYLYFVNNPQISLYGIFSKLAEDNGEI